MAGDFPNLSTATTLQWPKPNNIDPTTRGWFPPYAITLAALATAVMVARLRAQVKKSTFGLGIDDLLACLAWVFAILYSASTISGTLRYGFNRHIWDVSSRLYARAALVEWLSEGAFIFSTGLAKISVLCFFRRLEPPCTKAMKLIIYAFIAFTAAYSLGCILTQVLLCRPTAAYWDIPSRNHSVQRSCTSQHVFYPVQGSLDALSTFYCIMIPVLIVRNVPMSQFQRTGLRLVSIASLSILGIAITRTVFLYRLAVSVNGDATWNGFNVFIWSQLECQLLLIFASLPFFHRCFSQNPNLPIVYVYPATKERNDSVISRVSSSLSGQIKRIPLGRGKSVRDVGISRPRPQAVEIPEWEFQTLETPQADRSPVDEHTYDRYLAGMYGPPAPPKDSRRLFDQYRREHGEVL